MNIKEFLENASKVGLFLPMAYDKNKDGPSVTLLFVYLTSILSIACIVGLFQIEKQVATYIACVYSIIWVVLYLLRNLQKAKFDLDDRSFELESEEKKTPK